MSICVYIAGAYSSDPEGNTRRAIAVANLLLDLGYEVECPHLMHYLHQHRERSDEEWLAHGLAKLARCDVLLWDAARMPGPSPGAEAEVKFCRKRGIPACRSLAELLDEFPADGMETKGLSCQIQDEEHRRMAKEALSLLWDALSLSSGGGGIQLPDKPPFGVYYALYRFVGELLLGPDDYPEKEMLT